MSLAPVYDVVTTRYWPQFDSKLAMRIDGALYAAQATPSHWAKLARMCRLDPDRVNAIVSHTAWSITDRLDEAYQGMDAAMRDRLISVVTKSSQTVPRPDDSLIDDLMPDSGTGPTG